MTKPQRRVLKALKSLGSGWHSTTEVVRKMYPVKQSQKYNRSVYNAIFNLTPDKVKCKWDPKTHATCYQWRVK